MGSATFTLKVLVRKVIVRLWIRLLHSRIAPIIDLLITEILSWLLMIEIRYLILEMW